ncbi:MULTISPECIES: hypothetical protein [Methylobacterium]|uniref:hypothetical protein n=1 Tax=Methylobacterium TaxID=407 RepID=UPI0013ED31CD|nr:hypothetical protein [Methylobacterium sp. DB0501]NGM37576.1 hypothetical protein [Methylobacterium sp. DB0501]
MSLFPDVSFGKQDHRPARRLGDADIGIATRSGGFRMAPARSDKRRRQPRAARWNPNPKGRGGDMPRTVVSAP